VKPVRRVPVLVGIRLVRVVGRAADKVAKSWIEQTDNGIDGRLYAEKDVLEFAYRP
jgi:hypothetical protein